MMELEKLKALRAEVKAAGMLSKIELSERWMDEVGRLLELLFQRQLKGGEHGES